MGVDIANLVISKELDINTLRTKKVAIDAYNTIYQFLSVIRQRDGTQLKDSKGRVTSHLSGLFYRTCNLLEYGIKPCFIFDGQAPELKAETQNKRRKIKENAKSEHQKAIDCGDLESARKWGQQTSQLTKEMVSESKKLLFAMGLPYIQAIGEGEAQASWMVKEAMVYATVSQDFDSLLFGTPVLIRNLSISGKRKLPGKQAYVKIKPQIINLKDTLSELKITREELIKVSILIGTDYNRGIKGFGAKTALKIVKSGNFEENVSEIKHWKKIENIFLNPPIVKDFNLIWREPEKDEICHILCTEHEFSKKKVENALRKIKEARGARFQGGLDEFF